MNENSFRKQKLNSCPKFAETELTRLAKKAGMALTTSASQGLAEVYGLSASAPAMDRADLRDLIWAARSALHGCMPSRRLPSPKGMAFLLEFPTFVQGLTGLTSIQVVAQFDLESQTLHLRLPGEPEPLRIR